jgi:hypothetical protein
MFYKIFTAACLMLAPVILRAQQDTKATQNTPLENVDYKREGAPMPVFKYMSYNDTSSSVDRTLIQKKYPKNIYKERTDSSGKYTYMTAADLDNGNNLLVMMFNPTCSHCEDVAFMIEKNIDAFKKNKVVLLANKLMTLYIPDFTERHHIARYPNMYIGYDSSGYIDNTFLYQSLPQINIYDANRNLIKIFAGEVPLDTLKKYANYDTGRKQKKKG